MSGYVVWVLRKIGWRGGSEEESPKAPLWRRFQFRLSWSDSVESAELLPPNTTESDKSKEIRSADLNSI